MAVPLWNFSVSEAANNFDKRTLAADAPAAVACPSLSLFLLVSMCVCQVEMRGIFFSRIKKKKN